MVRASTPAASTPFTVVDLVSLSEMLEPIWGGDAELRLLLTNTLVGSFFISILMLLIWSVVLAPAIPAYAERSEADKVFLGNSFVSSWPAVTAPFVAITAAKLMPWDDVSRLMVSPCESYSVRAVGISCGYMLYDTLYCLYYKQMRSPLIIGHHIIPVLTWPYCALQGRALPIVLFFIMTEITNVGQHGRMLLLKLGLEETRVYRFVGVSWVVSFFVVRILPSPYLFFHLVNGNYAEFSTGEFWCVFYLTPLPFILNSYWFYLLFTGVVRFLTKDKHVSEMSERERALLRKNR